MSKMRAYDPAQVRTPRATMEVFTPLGMQIFIGMYWVGGLSGIMLGTLAINQGFFERFFDIQFLLIGQGGALAALGGAMFITATGMVSGARWSLDYAKRVAGISIIWSAVGILLAVYSAYNMPGLASSIVMYGVVAWLLVFGITLGLFGMRYLYSGGASIRRYAEYVSTEVLSGEGRRMLPPVAYDTVPTREPMRYVGRGRYCLNCGGMLQENWATCPRCGARTDATRDVS